MNFKEFKNPSNIFRNAPFWGWNDRLNKDELKRQMDEMLDKGWGSAFMHSRVGLVTGYLSDEWMEMTMECIKYASEIGMGLWLYDEDKWPSGFAGGSIPEMNEDFRPRALVLVSSNEKTSEDTVLKELNISNQLKYICKRVSALGTTWFNGASYVDLMNPEMVKAFLESTHEKYKGVCGAYFGKEVLGIFTDEPCYNFNILYDVPFVPWSDYLPGFFIKLKGYDILDYLEELFFDVKDYKKIRFDFYDAVTRLFLESFTKQYYKWCEENNLIFTGHFMAEENLISQTKWVGAAMPHYEYMHWPGVDKLTKNIEQNTTIKQLTSVAEQLGKERTLCEVFGCIGHDSNFFHRKWIVDWQAALGINFVNSHISLYSMRGERKRDHPSNLFFQQPWWEDEKLFSDYIGRLSFALTQGIRDIDILVIHPISSVWSELSPLHGGYDGGYNSINFDFSLEKSKYNIPFQELTNLLIANKLDFHYGDEMIMEKHAKLENGKLVVGKYSYSVVVVPPVLTLRSNTVRLLKEFSEVSGSKILFMNHVPERVDGIVSDTGLGKYGDVIQGTIQTIEKLNKLITHRVHITEQHTKCNAEKVICHIRTTNEGKLLFIANTDKNRMVNVTISMMTRAKPYLLDMATGNTYNIPFEVIDDRVEIRCKLYPAGSALINFTDLILEAEEASIYLNTGIEFPANTVIKDMIKGWEVTVKDQNVLPLHKTTVYLKGKKVLDNKHVAYAWHELFYKLAEGSEFKAEYKFNVKELFNKEIFCVIEMAENLQSIKLNGHELKAMKKSGDSGAIESSKSWLDVNFTKVPLRNYIKAGENVLTIEGLKENNIAGPGFHYRLDNFKNHKPTELETVYLVGDFCVFGDSEEGYFLTSPQKIYDSEVTKNGYPFYSGRLNFLSQFRYWKGEKRVYLKLENVYAASLKLYINGKYAGASFSKPFKFDITNYLKDGNNSIQITATNTLFNLMGPNWVSNITESIAVNPYSFINFNQFTDDYIIIPFGIGKGLILEV